MNAGPLVRFATALAADVTAFALPQRCPGCGQAAEPSRMLCDACLARIPRLGTPLCARCLAAGHEPAPCSRHAGYQVFVAWLYDDRAAELVQAFKYAERPALAFALGESLAAAVPQAWRRPDLVLEVPLHPVRERERGYNQAACLADALADSLAAPRWPGALLRTRATQPQARLGGAARRRNLQGAFVARYPKRLAGRRILLVDDVLTTGATLDACLEVLADCGATAAGVTLAWAQ
ncbi:MAG: phosphoribosyltransferase family protein [Candidatus Eisenbacteria bacterium]